MDRKNSSILVLLLAITIVGGVLASFGIPFLSEGIPKISTPDVSQSQGLSDSSLEAGGANAGFLSVEVTKTTVQYIIQSLQRQDSYYRELTFELFSEGGDSEQGSIFNIKAWTDGDCTMTTESSSSGLTQHIIVNEGKRYVWYGNDQRYRETPAEKKESDLAQRILTYEDVIDLPTENIVDAGHDMKDGKYCIWVEYSEESVGYLERYWIEIESGLLVAAETRNKEDGRLIQRLTETHYEAPINQQVKFILPDGTILHETQGASKAEKED